MVKRNILITGGTGAMGCELVAKLAGLGHSVHVLTLPGDPLAAMLDGTGAVIHYGDVSKPESLTGICNNIDLVFHLAAVIISNDESAFDKVNAAGTANMLREAKKSRCEAFRSCLVCICNIPQDYLLLSVKKNCREDCKRIRRSMDHYPAYPCLRQGGGAGV